MTLISENQDFLPNVCLASKRLQSFLFWRSLENVGGEGTWPGQGGVVCLAATNSYSQKSPIPPPPQSPSYQSQLKVTNAIS